MCQIDIKSIFFRDFQDKITGKPLVLSSGYIFD